MEKIQKTINDPCLIDLRVGLNSSTLNLESTTTKENLSINCEYDRSVKLTILYEPSNYPQEILDESDKSFGGSDNCVLNQNGEDLNQVNKWINDYGDPINWEQNIIADNFDNPKLEKYLELYHSLIILEYHKESHEDDSIYVNSLGDNYPMFAGENNWCKCSITNNWMFSYETLADNPYNKPRVAYFEHKTKNERLKSGKHAGYKIYDNYHNQSYNTWGVIVIQRGNPNANDTEITYLNLWGEEYRNKYVENYEGDPNDEVYEIYLEEILKNKSPLYSVGIISNANFNINDINNSQYKSDLQNALTYFNKQNIKFISNIGDLCISSNKDLIKFEEFYRLYAYSNQIRMFTCFGEYDYMKFYNDQNAYNQISKFNMNKIHKDIKYFEYDGVWNQVSSGDRNIKGKTNYYFTYNHEDTDTEDIFIYLSVDYGTNKFSENIYFSKAINKLDYNDKYVKELIPFAIKAGYNKEIDGNFDYQFYNSNTLIWLKDIIENNLDNHIFVFMHHGLPHKAGNGTSYNAVQDKKYSYYSKIYPYDMHKSIMKGVKSGSNSLCGLQFYFLNYLNNKYKNVTWFSGHSCYSWQNGMPEFIKFTGDQYLNFCNKEFNIYKPNGNEYYLNPSDSESISKDYNETIYTRVPVEIPIKDADDHVISSRYVDNPIDISAWNIHIPSLTYPSLRSYENKNNYLYKGSEGAILDIYPNGYKIRQILFKDDNMLNYINTVIGEKLILFG